MLSSSVPYAGYVESVGYFWNENEKKDYKGLIARKSVFMFLSKRVSNRSLQLLRLARKLKFHL